MLQGAAGFEQTAFAVAVLWRGSWPTAEHCAGNMQYLTVQSQKENTGIS